MDLVLQSAEPAAGAHRKQIVVAFSAAQETKPAVDYVRILAEHLDAVRADLNEKPVEMDITDLRDSSSSPALFPPGRASRTTSLSPRRP